MIRGAIDYADRQRVAGWIYSDVADVSGRTVLAFLDKDCVGAGALDVFRQDLADAGLGDGMVGFSFGVGTSDDDIARVTVRLEGSDFCLIQRQARIVADTLAETLRAKKRIEIADIEWMHGRGWLDLSEYDFLTYITNIGLYDLALRLRAEPMRPEVAAKRFFELYAQGPLKIGSEKMNPEEIAARRLELMADLPIPIVAIHGDDGALSLLEGSNRDEDFLATKDMVGAVQHGCSAGQLLFLDLRTQVRGIGENAATVYLPR